MREGEKEEGGETRGKWHIAQIEIGVRCDGVEIIFILEILLSVICEV